MANIAPQLDKVCAKPPPSQNSTGMPRQTLTFRRHHSQSLQCQSIHCQTYNRPRNSVLFKFIECLNSINNLYSNLSFINKHIRTFWKTLCKLYLGLVASEWQDDDLTCNSFCQYFTIYQPSSRMPGILFKWKGKTHDVLNINTNRKLPFSYFMLKHLCQELKSIWGTSSRNVKK